MERGILPLSIVEFADLLGVGNVWVEVLPITRAFDIAEHWRPGRQASWSQEVRIENVVAVWRIVDTGAAFESTGGVYRVIEFYQRTLVIESLHATGVAAISAPVFQETEEVVHAAVGSEEDAGFSGGIAECHAYSTSDCNPVISSYRIFPRVAV